MFCPKHSFVEEVEHDSMSRCCFIHARLQQNSRSCMCCGEEGIGSTLTSQYRNYRKKMCYIRRNAGWRRQKRRVTAVRDNRVPHKAAESETLITFEVGVGKRRCEGIKDTRASSGIHVSWGECETSYICVNDGVNGIGSIAQ